MKQSGNKKLAICITMYNEQKKELMYTMAGVFQNFEILKKNHALESDDICVFLIADGMDGLKNDFLKFGSNKFYDEADIIPFMEKDEHDERIKMKKMENLFKKDC